MLQTTVSSPPNSFPVPDATSLGALFAQALNLLVAPLPAPTVYDPSRPTLPSEIISLILHQLLEDDTTSAPPAASFRRASSPSPEKLSTTRCTSRSTSRDSTIVFAR
jgi:hypothetical protein